MSADNIFVVHDSNLQNLQPPSQDKEWKRLETWTVQQLWTWLGRRGVRASEACKKDLIRVAYFTWKLALPVNNDEVTTQKEAAERLENLLFLDERALANPAAITQWEPDLKLLPSVAYPNIYNYLINTPGINAEKLKAYKSLESYNYAINGWVEELFVHTATDEIVFVKAKVKPSQHRSAPYDAWVMLRKNGEVEAARCSCTAGLGEVCSHVGAILFKTMGAGLKGLNQPDACTSKACEWNRAFCKQVMPELVNNINFELPKINKDRKRRRQTEKPRRDISWSCDDCDLWEVLADCAPNAMGLCLLPPPSRTKFFPAIEEVTLEVSVINSDPILCLPPLISTLINTSTASNTFDMVRTSVTAEESDLIFKTTVGQSAKSLWHEVRQHRITASIMGDVYRFMTSNRPSPSITLMCKIMGTAKSLDHVTAIKWGREHEDDAIADYSTRLLRGTCKEDLVIQKCGIRIPPGDAHIGASPDGYAVCSCHGERLLEVKSPHKAAMLDLSPQEAAAQGHISFLQRDGNLKTTDRYYTQVQAQMALLDVGACDFIVWTPKDIIVERIMFDQHYWNLVKACLDSFYKDHVIPQLTDKPVPEAVLVAPPKAVRRKRSAIDRK